MKDWLTSIPRFLFPGLKSKRLISVLASLVFGAWAWKAFTQPVLPEFPISALVALALIIGASGGGSDN